MKTIIIDDERLARQALKNLLQAFSEIQIIDEAVNGPEAIEKINQLLPDLIFLDIQMPGMTGFEVLQKLEKTPKVVFVTAYDEYAIKAFEVNALDYLLKPIEQKRLENCILKIQDLQKIPTQDTFKTEATLTEDDRVFVKDGEKCWFVTLKDVRLFESEGNYVRVYFNQHKPLILKSLNNLEERLSQKQFFRASRKHILNLKWIEKIEPWFNGGLMAELKGGEKIEISRRQSTRFKDLMSL
jgi:two-component system LytT family response regulator